MGATYPQIRDAFLAAVEALTPPTRNASTRYRAHRDVQPFAEWCAANPLACFRRFEMLAGLDLVKEGIGSGDQWMFTQSLNLVMAYPRRELGKYGLENERHLDDVIQADFHLIDKAIGQDGSHQGNYVAGLHSSVLNGTTPTRSPSGDVVFMTSNYQLSYDRSY